MLTKPMRILAVAGLAIAMSLAAPAHPFSPNGTGAAFAEESDDISANLPFAPTQDVVVDPVNPNRIIVASDLGVFITNVASAGSQNPNIKWLRLGDGLPRVPVNDLEYHAATNSLYAATYGRGIFRLSLDREG